MAAAVPRKGTWEGRLRTPVCAFVIVYGVARLAELIDWSRLHHDAAAMLGLGSGAVTGLLVAGKAAELALTVLAVTALTRASDTLLFAALAGWTADLAVLTVVAVVGGDLGRVLEHGLMFAAFATLQAVAYVYGGVRPKRPSTPAEIEGPHETRRDLSTGTAEPTRQDLPVRRPEPTRQDLPVRRPDVTRQDIHVRKPPSS